MLPMQIFSRLQTAPAPTSKSSVSPGRWIKLIKNNDVKMGQQIFIGNFPVELDNNESQQYFVQFGEIIQVIIIRERNTFMLLNKQLKKKEIDN